MFLLASPLGRLSISSTELMKSRKVKAKSTVHITGCKGRILEPKIINEPASEAYSVRVTACGKGPDCKNDLFSKIYPLPTLRFLKIINIGPGLLYHN